MSAENKDKKTE